MLTGHIREGTSQDRVVLDRSTDGGATFTETELARASLILEMDLTLDGMQARAAWRSGWNDIATRASANGGATWSRATRAVRVPDGDALPGSPNNVVVGTRTLLGYEVAVDHYDGDIYVTTGR